MKYELTKQLKDCDLIHLCIQEGCLNSADLQYIASDLIPFITQKQKEAFEAGRETKLIHENMPSPEFKKVYPTFQDYLNQTKDE